jgi:hypothetical protein
MPNIKALSRLQGQCRSFQIKNLLTVYLDGELIGSLEEGGGNVLARDGDGHILGTYTGRPAALRAIEAAQP